VEEAAAGNAEEGPTLAEVQAELDKHPEIPAEIKARILTEAPAAIREAIAASRQATAGRAAPAAAARVRRAAATTAAAPATRARRSTPRNGRTGPICCASSPRTPPPTRSTARAPSGCPTSSAS
jgi:hypothetical protein